MAGRVTKDKNYDGSTPLEDVKQELFTEIFTSNVLPRFWNNGQNSYEFAYGFTDRIEKIQDEIQVLQKQALLPKGKRKKSIAQSQREIDEKREQIEKIGRTCRSNSSRLLTYDYIKKRIGHRLDNLSIKVIVDRELTYLIQQRDDNNVKISAIEHYNKREQRIREKVEIKHAFEPIRQVKVEAPAKK